MPQSRPPYPPEFRRQMLELVRPGSYAFGIVTGDTSAAVGWAGAESVSDPRQSPGGKASASTSVSTTPRNRGRSSYGSRSLVTERSSA